MDAHPSHYTALGLLRTASAADIKKAWRKLARAHHPDISRAVGADVRMADLNAAYEVLSNRQKRAAYDAPTPPPPWSRPSHGKVVATASDSGWNEGFNFRTMTREITTDQDLFEQIFSETILCRHTHQAPEAGRDIHTTVELTLKEAYEGTKKLLADDLEVTIPKGVFEGQTIRFSGRGEAGFGNADPGDLFLKIKFQPDVQWRTVGRDVYGGPVLLAPWEAALGVRTRVRTPTGEVDVTIPQGWLYGRVLRLKGRGIPAGASAPKAGDLFLDLAVALPRADGPAARDAYAAMASAFPEFVPRTA